MEILRGTVIPTWAITHHLFLHYTIIKSVKTYYPIKTYDDIIH